MGFNPVQPGRSHLNLLKTSKSDNRGRSFHADALILCESDVQMPDI